MDCLRAVAVGIEEVLLEAERERRAEEGQRAAAAGAGAEEAPGEESRRSCGRVTWATELEEVRTFAELGRWVWHGLESMEQYERLADCKRAKYY